MQLNLSLHHERINGYDVVIRNSSYKADKTHIVLVHGIGVSSRYFLPLARELAAHYNVTTLDMPGYGASSKPRHPLTIIELADVIEALLVQRHISSAILIGHSMGTQIVAHVARKNPSLVRKLVLLAPTVYDKERTVWMQFLRLLQDGFHETPRANIIIFLDYVRMGMLRYIRTAKWMVKDAIEETLRDVEVPTLIVRGRNDPIAPMMWTEYLRSRYPLIRLEYVSNAPHALHYAFPEKVAALCRTFIQDA